MISRVPGPLAGSEAGAFPTDVAGEADERSADAPKFVTGSLRRHIVVMTTAGAVGLMAIFIGDLANILFVSMLDDTALVAAIGYSSALIFSMVSVGIGLSIAATSLVSPALGARRRTEARRLATNALVVTAAVSALISLLLWPFVPDFLTLLGASGRTLGIASEYVRIILPSMPALAVGITSAAILRSQGDAKLAMYVTLSGAAVNVILDPIFIFGLGLGIHGAALASVCARIVVMAVGLYGVIAVHNLAGRFNWETLPADALALSRVAVPAIATNLATPFANGYVTAAIAEFGDSAVAGWAIIGRVMPVAFGAIFALTGAVAPIIGQNFGAASRERMRETLIEALKVTAAFTLAAWIALALSAPWIATLFRMEGLAEELILTFSRVLAPLFFFLGAMFVSNAAFNTLGRPHYSTVANWARATLGTIPFVTLGGWMAGAPGVIAGNLIGGIIFGFAAVWVCLRLIDRMPLAPR